MEKNRLAQKTTEALEEEDPTDLKANEKTTAEKDPTEVIPERMVDLVEDAEAVKICTKLKSSVSNGAFFISYDLMVYIMAAATRL